MRINCNKKGSVYRDEFVCPLLAEAEAANCDGSCVFWEAKAARALLGKANWGDRSESSPGRRPGRETHTMLLLLASSLRAESLLFLPSLQLLEARGSTRGSVVIHCTRVGDENPTSCACVCFCREYFSTLVSPAKPVRTNRSPSSESRQRESFLFRLFQAPAKKNLSLPGQGTEPPATAGLQTLLIDLPA